MSGPVEVVAGYTARAPWTAADVVRAVAPRGLPWLLAGVEHVAEVPCGAGHFLDSYAAVGAAVTLVDANAAMLATAQTRATRAGIRAVHTVPALLPDLPPLPECGAVVLPHGALNQLAAQQDLVVLLRAVRAAVAPGVRLLVQLLDPGAHPLARGPHGRRIREPAVPLADGSHVVRSHRTHRHGRVLDVELAYTDTNRRHYQADPVRMQLLPGWAVAEAVTEAGWTHTVRRPGPGGYLELTAHTPTEQGAL
jgi:SAM-dependent methyltransferase